MQIRTDNTEIWIGNDYFVYICGLLVVIRRLWLIRIHILIPASI